MRIHLRLTEMEKRVEEKLHASLQQATNRKGIFIVSNRTNV